MEIVIVPDAGAEERAVVLAALRAVDAEHQPTYTAKRSRWLTAALAEGVEREAQPLAYTPSPRKSRGAARA